MLQIGNKGFQHFQKEVLGNLRGYGPELSLKGLRNHFQRKFRSKAGLPTKGLGRIGSRNWLVGRIGGSGL